MSSSKSFGVRMPLQQYLIMVEVCAKNNVSMTDLVIHSLNRVGVFSENFSVGGALDVSKIKDLEKQVTELIRQNNKLTKINEYNKSEIDDLKKLKNIVCHSCNSNISNSQLLCDNCYQKSVG
jgi:hypothetical protein